MNEPKPINSTLNRTLCKTLGIAPKRWTYYGSDGPEEVVEYPDLSMWDGTGMLLKEMVDRGFALETRTEKSFSAVRFHDLKQNQGYSHDADAVYAATLPLAVLAAAVQALGIQ